jgi:hypothetical protein
LPSRPYIWLAAAACLASACATTEPQTIVALPTPPSTATAPAIVRLAWLPVEPRASATLAGLLNGRLARVAVDGVTDTVQAPVSLEMAQLAIECIERTPACYSAVGRSLGADRLLWAEVERGPRGALTVRVSLFDVVGAALVRKVEHAYPNGAAARAGVAALVDGGFPARAPARSASP